MIVLSVGRRPPCDVRDVRVVLPDLCFVAGRVLSRQISGSLQAQQILHFFPYRGEGASANIQFCQRQRIQGKRKYASLFFMD